VSETFVTRFDVSGRPCSRTYTVSPPHPVLTLGWIVDQRGSVYLPRLKLDPTGPCANLFGASQPSPTRPRSRRSGSIPMGHVHVLGQAGSTRSPRSSISRTPNGPSAHSSAGSGTDQASADRSRRGRRHVRRPHHQLGRTWPCQGAPADERRRQRRLRREDRSPGGGRQITKTLRGSGVFMVSRR